MYAQITQEERYFIAAWRRDHSIRAIAAALGRSPSTVSREIRRNRRADGGYRAFTAGEHARARRSKSRRGPRYGREVWAEVERLLRLNWSPEQIAGWLRAAGGPRVSHETIYVHIWRDKRRGGSLWRHLRQAGKKRRKRYGAYDSRGRLAGKRHISERPVAADLRSEIGHWEIDTVMGTDRARHSVLTLVERRSGFVLIGKLERHCAAHCNARLLELMSRHPGRFKTITADNGSEFHSYADMEEATGVLFYFATPHHSWERGSNENTNGLIRQFLPKRQSMAHITQADCDEIAAKLNARPRKRHGFRTPEECYVQSR